MPMLSLSLLKSILLIMSTPNTTQEDQPSNHCGLLMISGVDAKKFLQGQMTCNLEEVTPGQSRLGAHCNPQGRVLFLFRIFDEGLADFVLFFRVGAWL